jgi:filamentous hemagglutinin family protein
MNYSHRQASYCGLFVLPLLLIFGTKGAIAQVNPANDGTGTIVKTQNNQINISGGTQAGSNQFHSFQQFGVNAGQTANFLSNPNISNILGRVTGGDASLINGILKVSGSNANLYLINPNGIVFGKDASLNVPGAFTATTANGIGFGNGQWFNATGSNNYSVLSTNPASFGFVGTSGTVVNAGNLTVKPGQRIALVGGTVVNTGTIAAPGGDITIAAIPGEKMVRIGQAGTVLSLDLPTSDRALMNAPITTPLSLPELLTGGSIPRAMGVVVEDGVIMLRSGSASLSGTLNVDGTGSQNGGNVVAYADKHLNVSAILTGTNVNLQAGNAITVNAAIDASGNAKVGNLTITTPTANLNQAIVLKTGSTLSGTATTVNVGATGTVQNGIDVAATGGTVNLAAATYTLGQTVGINKDVTVRGAGLGSTTVSGNNEVRVFEIGFVNRVTLEKLSIVKGRSGALGGGISNRGGLTLNDSLVANNVAQMDGGGIYNSGGSVRINNSTISGNSTESSSVGAGLFNDGGSSMTLQGSTVSDNTGGGIFSRGSLTVSNSTISGNRGSGIFARGGITVSNSTISNNSGGGLFITTQGIASVDNSIISGNIGQDGISREILFEGRSLSLSHNLLGFGGNSSIFAFGKKIDLGGNSGVSGITSDSTNIVPTVPLNRILAPLANNGGLTKTHALVIGSPAINAGDPNSRLTIDQRGEKRGRAGLNTGSRIDIGAYEATSSVIKIIGFNRTFTLILPAGSATPIENWIQRILGLLTRN